MTDKTAYEVVDEKRNTLFSVISGLPGYKPIFPVRLGYYLTILLTSVGFIGFCVGFVWTAINIPTDPTIVKSFFTQNSVPLSGIVFVGGWLALIVAGVTLSITSKISIVYEREYEKWVSEVVPPNDKEKYPPQAYWETVTGKHIDEPPVCGPRELREDTLSERGLDFVGWGLGWILHSPFYVLLTFPRRNTLQAPPMQKEIERESERSTRRDEY